MRERCRSVERPVGGVRDLDTCVVQRAQVYWHVAGLLTRSLTVDNATRPRFTVAKFRLIVVAEDIEIRRAETADGGDLGAGGGNLLGLLFRHPIDVLRMNLLNSSEANRVDQRQIADSVYLKRNAEFFASSIPAARFLVSCSVGW